MALTPAMLFPAVIKTDSTEDGNHVILVTKNTAPTPVVAIWLSVNRIFPNLLSF